MTSNTKEHHFETSKTLVWVDCEMTGLNPNKDSILEIACILTDSDLEELDTCGPLVVHTPKDILNNMNEWCKKTHKKSGLIYECLNSNLTIQDVDELLYQFLKKRDINLAALVGNSISYDRQFLEIQCPKFSSLLHYRNIDVSSFKEITKRWYPQNPSFVKKVTHRALDDIRKSISELKFYRANYFINKCKLQKA